MTQGIYELEINGIKYIGKDSHIDENKRVKHHVWMLKNNKHFNKHLQRAYNKYEEINYSRLIEFGDIDEETLNKAEMFYIDMFDTFEEGFNQTKGGEGVKGRTLSDEEIEKMKETKRIGYETGKFRKTNGEINGMVKLTESQVKEIVKEFYKEDYDSKNLAKKYNVSSEAISTIYTGKRWSYLDEIKEWLNFKELNKHKLRKQGKNTLLPVVVYEIKHLLLYGETEKKIAEIYNTSVMTVNRINRNEGYFSDIDITKPHSYYKL